MRVLLLNQNHIGDALFTTPAIAALKRLHPGATLVNATSPGAKPLFEGNPHVSGHWVRPTRGAAEFARFVHRARRGRFDVVISMAASSTRFGLFARLSGAPTRIGFEHPATRRFFTHTVRIGSALQHHADDHLDQVRLLGPVAGTFPFELYPVSGWTAKWEAVRAALGLEAGRPLVGLNPGATMGRKQWAPERWAELSDSLFENGCQPLLFGGPGDRALVEGILALCARPAPSAQGRLSLGALAMAAADCAAFVSGDTGPLHVAVAMRTPVIALHGPTDPRRTGPYPPGAAPAVILYHPQSGEGRPMDAVSVKEVLDAVPRALEMHAMR